ncbi:MAG: aminotransferase class I/II-fold pyridoxal phosphate-dependent enzyme, partial [Candidatus Marsarchaeota archaeon]|nr:aminotransferase class I/II-fold pyridoxal phosphate-dependent enzyme [Candidatus Marsarchaeota archaeon]
AELPIRDIVQRARQVAARGMPMHWFNIGDPNRFDFVPPPWITKAVHEALDDPKFSGYAPSDGDEDLRAALAESEGIPPERIIISTGLSEGLSFAMQALMDSGDNVLLPSPNYPLYASISRVLGGEENLYACDGQWQPDVDDMRRRLNARTRAIVIINPNNPTGAVYPRKTLKAIVELAGEHSIPVIADEIYDKLAFSGPLEPVWKLSSDVPVIRGCGLSKNFFYPGARVGWLAMHGPGLDDFASALVRLCNARLSVNWEMQRGAIAAVQHAPDHLPAALSRLRSRRDLIVRRLNEIPGIRTTSPQAAFYIFPQVTAGPWKTDTEFVYDLMEQTGIVGVPGSGFSPQLNGLFFRLVYLSKEDELAAAMDKLEKFMKKKVG